MFARIRSLFARHPLLRDAVLWAIPALLFGAVLRGMLLSYQPYAYWGSDSNSYFSFANMLLGRGLISLDEKRRLLYPLLMVPLSLLPGEPLRWVAWFQHGLGLAALLPLAYAVRKIFVHWRLWIVPVTLIYAGTPAILWYEHELLGEAVFFAALVWMIAGWCAWTGEARRERARQLFWWFFAAFAVFILTKPSGRFVWPGIALGLLIAGAWRSLDWRRWAALGALLIATMLLGSKKQGAWLLLTANFPLVRLETPLHAEYKAEVRDLVEPLRREIGNYHALDEEVFNFLERPRLYPDRPHWQALADDSKKRTKIYMDVALEGVKARPDLAVFMSVQRAVASANSSAFKEDRFTASYFAGRFEHHYEEGAQAVAKGKLTAIPMLFNLPRTQSLPPYADFRARLAPRPDAPAARWLESWARRFGQLGDVVHWPKAAGKSDRRLALARPTVLGWWLIVGALVCALPRYRATLGVWTLVALGYLVGVFLASVVHPRYFAPALPVLVILLAAPADALVRLAVAGFARRAAPAA